MIPSESSCCDNIEIEETGEYNVCRSCGIVGDINPLKEPELIYRSEATNIIFTTMKTYSKFYGNYRKLRWIHCKHSTLEYKERNLYLYKLQLGKICEKYNIPKKYGFQILYYMLLIPF